MPIEIVLEGQLGKGTGRGAFSASLKQVRDKKKLKLEDYDVAVMIDIYPEEYIEYGYKDRFVSTAVQASAAESGLHAFVCTVFDEIISGSQIPLGVDDPTGYYTDRNFENLKYKYFYRQLKDIQGYVLSHIDEGEELYISWLQEYYHLVHRGGFVVTPLGYIHRDDSQIRDVEGLADDSLMRNDRKRTARYYCNCVMVLLRKEYYFAYSFMNEYTDEIASNTLDRLEAAYEKDGLLLLPMDAYRSICTAIYREILIQHMDEPKVAHLGYRNGVVSYLFESQNIPVHGCSEKSFDETIQTVHFMAPYEDTQEPRKWMIKANAHTFEEKIPVFPKKLEEPVGVMDAFSLEKEAVIRKGIVKNLGEHYTVVVQTNCERDTLFPECIMRDEQNIAMLEEWRQGIKHRVTINDELYS